MPTIYLTEFEMAQITSAINEENTRILEKHYGDIRGIVKDWKQANDSILAKLAKAQTRRKPQRKQTTRQLLVNLAVEYMKRYNKVNTTHNIHMALENECHHNKDTLAYYTGISDKAFTRLINDIKKRRIRTKHIVW